MTATITLKIESIAAGGDGVARHEGMVAFVPRVAPGDLVSATVVPQGRLLRGRVQAVIEPSSDRVDPPCRHYTEDRCGGCQLQHLRYDAQLEAKSGIIRDALQRIGRVALDAPAVEPSAHQWRYRRKLTLALRRVGGRWIAGLRRYDAPDEVFELVDCPITQAAVVQHWHAIMARSELLPRARELRGAVRLLDQGFAFTLEGGERWTTSAEFVRGIQGLRELWWRPEERSLRRLHSDNESAAGASFVQVNPEVARDLRQRVLTLARAARPTTVVDAYAGVGEIGLTLAQEGARVTTIESDRAAVAVGAERLPQGSRAVAGRVEDRLAEALPADVVILNPPRAGLHERVPQVLNAVQPLPRAIVYVSCNPATLARDLRRLDRYQVRSVQGFDMFPQTAHVETACLLEPAA